MRSVTKQAIREARLKEIKEELLHSERLKVRQGPVVGCSYRPLARGVGDGPPVAAGELDCLPTAGTHPRCNC